MKKRISKIEYEISIKSLNLNECQVEHLNKMLENVFFNIDLIRLKMLETLLF